MSDLIQGIINLILAIALYFLGKSKGKTDAEKSQLQDDIKGKEDAEQFIDSRMSRFESELQAFKKQATEKPYSDRTDDELIQLHKGETLTDFTQGANEVTTTDRQEPTRPTGKIQGSD